MIVMDGVGWPYAAGAAIHGVRLTELKVGEGV